MITCPECGLEQPESHKFCDRCGRDSLRPPLPRAYSMTRPTPLAPGTVVRGYEIVELLAQDSIENRYRAIRKAEGKEEKVTLARAHRPDTRGVARKARRGSET